jgi:hypothetical protein
VYERALALLALDIAGSFVASLQGAKPQYSNMKKQLAL